MAVTNQKHIERQASQLLERVALIHNQDGRLRIDRKREFLRTFCF